MLAGFSSEQRFVVVGTRSVVSAQGDDAFKFLVFVGVAQVILCYLCCYGGQSVRIVFLLKYHYYL